MDTNLTSVVPGRRGVPPPPSLAEQGKYPIKVGYLWYWLGCRCAGRKNKLLIIIIKNKKEKNKLGAAGERTAWV